MLSCYYILVRFILLLQTVKRISFQFLISRKPSIFIALCFRHTKALLKLTLIEDKFYNQIFPSCILER